MISPLTAAQTLPIRQSVLWPEHPPSHAAVTGDGDALHYGFKQDGEWVAVGSLFITDTGAQLRKLATLPAQQGKGIGRALVTHIIAEAQTHGAKRFWCDARITAMSFYQGFGMTPTGDPFEKKGRPYQVMELPLV